LSEKSLFFYRRPVPDDFSSTAESQGWNIENEYAALDFVVDEEAEDEFSDYGLGRFFYSYFNPFSFYIYKRLNNEFIYSFLEFFFITMLRVLFLFLFFFFFFFLRSLFLLCLRSEFFYYLFFFFLFIFSFFKILGFIYIFSKFFFYWKRIYVFWLQFFNSFIVVQFLLFNDQLEEMFYTFKYSGRMIFLCKYRI
jgi:hypothetical protein